jgi:3-oxoacyl-[acyl-carrier protein] reductase
VSRTVQRALRSGLTLAREGAHVIVNARSNQAEANAVVREAQALGVRAISIIADMAKKDQVEAMARARRRR